MIDLKYKTFDSLMADVQLDFRNYTLENLIEPQELIRVARWCTAELGLKLFSPKEDVFELHHGRIKLPDGFHILNYGLLCGEGMIKVARPQGVTTMEIPYPSYVETPIVKDCNEDSCPVPEACTYTCGGCNNCGECTPGIVVVPGYNPLYPTGDPCIKPRVFMDCKGDAFELVQIVAMETRRWKIMLPLKLVNPGPEVHCACPNIHVNCPDHIWIKDGFLNSNLKCGKIYMNWDSNLENAAGDLLVPDHDLITPFYEYSIKSRILENLFIAGEDVQNRIGLIDQRRRAARIQAWNVVRMPDFADIEMMYLLNRKAFANKYTNAFRTCYGGQRW